jgi:hypothetical protein
LPRVNPSFFNRFSNCFLKSVGNASPPAIPAKYEIYA